MFRRVPSRDQPGSLAVLYCLVGGVLGASSVYVDPDFALNSCTVLTCLTALPCTVRMCIVQLNWYRR